MYRLLEDSAKDWLSGFELPVPKGETARTPQEAQSAAARFSDGVFLKALVPTGRRGKAGAVRYASSPRDAAAAAAEMLGGEALGHAVAALYVEERIEIASEYFLSFTMSEKGPQVVASREGGVEIEALFKRSPDAVVRLPIDPMRGFPEWRAVELWRLCGVEGMRLRALGAVTSRLYDAFVQADAELLEINPLAESSDGRLWIVGAMMAIDDHALFRRPQWREAAARDAASGGTERERRVHAANLALPGGEAQYTELDGDIGLLVGGGGAGLYIHDLIVEMGARPANHCVTPPTGSDPGKLREVIRAIVDNPSARSLLVAFNFAQMARADTRMRALVEVLREKSLDTTRFPIVVRLFGAGEAESRELAGEFPGIAYLPRGASLREAVAEIVARTNKIRFAVLP